MQVGNVILLIAYNRAKKLMSFDIFPLNVHTAATPAENLICYCTILIFWEHLFMFVRISIFGGISTQIDMVGYWFFNK